VPAARPRRFLQNLRNTLSALCDTSSVSRDISQEGGRHIQGLGDTSLEGTWYFQDIIWQFLQGGAILESVARHFSKRRPIHSSIVRHSFYGRAIHFYVAPCWHTVAPEKRENY
jgi:hypothetical protein